MPTPMMNRDHGFLRKIAWHLALMAAALAAIAERSQAASESRRTAVVEAVEKVSQCVVSISSEKKSESHSRWPFSPEENQRKRVNGMGSGVLIDRRGYILTNHHVVDKVQGIVVQLFDGTSYTARLLQYDAIMDLAVLKVDAPRLLAAIDLGTSSDLMVGETVITIGNAFGYENTVSERHHQRPASRRHTLGRPGLSELDPDGCLYQPREFGWPSDQHRGTTDRHQRGGSRRCPGDRFCSAHRRGQASGLGVDEHPADGVDLAWPGHRRTAPRGQSGASWLRRCKREARRKYPDSGRATSCSA